MSEGVWLFARGTLKAHYVTKGTHAICGRTLFIENPDVSCSKIIAEPFKCKACLKALKNLGLQSSEDKKKAYCSKCGGEFPSVDAIRSHLKTCQKGTFTPEEFQGMQFSEKQGDKKQ
jgi:hypothetical protein